MGMGSWPDPSSVLLGYWYHVPDCKLERLLVTPARSTGEVKNTAKKQAKNVLLSQVSRILNVPREAKHVNFPSPVFRVIIVQGKCIDSDLNHNRQLKITMEMGILCQRKIAGKLMPGQEKELAG
jgi:hypothetical protein